MPLEVLRKTSRDAVVVKPAGQSTEAPGDAATLIAQARAEFGWPDAQVPHRLDRPTRGLVVIARDSAAVALHNEHIRAGRWTKHYIARCAGAVALGPHKAFLKREGKRAHIVRSGGDPAFLVVQAVASAPGMAGQHDHLIRLDTGRFHQIRVMLAALGAPIVGDAEYGWASGGAAGGGTGGARVAHGTFYLEHASLWLPDLDSGELTRVFNANDPARPAIDPALSAELLAAKPRE